MLCMFYLTKLMKISAVAVGMATLITFAPINIAIVNATGSSSSSRATGVRRDNSKTQRKVQAAQKRIDPVKSLESQKRISDSITKKRTAGMENLKNGTTRKSVSSSSQSSSVSSESTSARVKRNIDAWTKLHNDMIDRAKELAHQTRGSGCIQQIAAIEKDFIAKYNEYVNYANGPLTSTNALDQIEKSMKTIQEEFEATPIVCY